MHLKNIVGIPNLNKIQNNIGIDPMPLSLLLVEIKSSGVK